MDNVKHFRSNVNEPPGKVTLEEVKKWVEGQAAKADMGEASARIRITSLMQMQEQVASDEPGDAAWVLENIERLHERWARRNLDAKTDTARTYASRAKTTIAAYLEWAAAPDKYNPRKVLQKQKDPNAPKRARSASRSSSVVEQQQATPAPKPMFEAPPARSALRTFPLGGDRDFAFYLPEGMTFAEVKKISVHLLTLATDFDIADQSQAQVFSLMVRAGNNI